MTSATIQATTPPDTARLCGYCGANGLQRKPRTFFHIFFSFYPYQCGRCNERQTKFRLRWHTLLRFAAALSVLGAAGYLALNPNIFFRHTSTQSSVDALAGARTSMGGQLSAFEQMMVKKPRTSMSNGTILQLWRAKVGTDVILQMIRTSTPDYDLSANAVIDLKQAGVDQSVVLAIIDASYTAH